MLWLEDAQRLLLPLPSLTHTFCKVPLSSRPFHTVAARLGELCLQLGILCPSVQLTGYRNSPTKGTHQEPTMYCHELAVTGIES